MVSSVDLCLHRIVLVPVILAVRCSTITIGILVVVLLGPEVLVVEGVLVLSVFVSIVALLWLLWRKDGPEGHESDNSVEEVSAGEASIVALHENNSEAASEGPEEEEGPCEDEQDPGKGQG